MQTSTPTSTTSPHSTSTASPHSTMTAELALIDWTAAPPDTIDVGHSRVAYRRVGDGPDLVFVHGWPLHGATFRDLLPHLVDSFTCHLIDLPGTGFTVWDDDTPISIADHAETLRRVINALGLERYALVAHDSGGTIARLAAADDERVAAVVLGNTEIPGHHPVLLQMILTTARLPGGKAMMTTMLGTRWLRRSALLLGSCFRDPDFADGSFHELFLEPMLTSPRQAAGQMKLLDGFDWAEVDQLAEVHSRISAPVQLVWGTDDPYFRLAKARPMMAQFPGGAELVEIEGGKLYVHEEEAERFAEAMRPFVLRCFQGSSSAAAA